MLTADSANLVLFGALGVMVLAWFVLVKLLLDRLAAMHPETYDAMGQPSLFARNTPGRVLKMLAFIVGREHRPLGDRYLSKLSDIMLVFAIVYLALFVLMTYQLRAAAA